MSAQAIKRTISVAKMGFFEALRTRCTLSAELMQIARQTLSAQAFQQNKYAIKREVRSRVGFVINGSNSGFQKLLFKLKISDIGVAK